MEQRSIGFKFELTPDSRYCINFMLKYYVVYKFNIMLFAWHIFYMAYFLKSISQFYCSCCIWENRDIGNDISVNFIELTMLKFFCDIG